MVCRVSRCLYHCLAFVMLLYRVQSAISQCFLYFSYKWISDSESESPCDAWPWAYSTDTLEGSTAYCNTCPDFQSKAFYKYGPEQLLCKILFVANKKHVDWLQLLVPEQSYTQNAMHWVRQSTTHFWARGSKRCCLSSSGLKSNNSPMFLLDINIDSPYICCAWRCSTTVVHQLCVLCILPPAKSSYCAVFGASHVLVVPGLALFVVAVGVNPCCPSPSIRVALDCLHVVVWSIAPPMMHLHLWGCCWCFQWGFEPSDSAHRSSNMALVCNLHAKLVVKQAVYWQTTVSAFISWTCSTLTDSLQLV